MSCQKRMLAYRGKGRGRKKMYVRRKKNFHSLFLLVKSFDKENKKKIIVCLLIMIINYDSSAKFRKDFILTKRLTNLCVFVKFYAPYTYHPRKKIKFRI